MTNLFKNDYIVPANIVAPPEGLRDRGTTGVNLRGQPRGQGVIPRRFMQKKCDERINERKNARTDGRVGRIVI